MVQKKIYSVVSNKDNSFILIINLLKKFLKKDKNVFQLWESYWGEINPENMDRQPIF